MSITNVKGKHFAKYALSECPFIFDIDGILFEFFMNFLNIEKKFEFCFQYFMFSSRFILFPILKKNWCTKKLQNFRGGVKICIYFLIY